MLTQERLKQLLHYDPKTGVFTWLPNRNRRNSRADRIGKPAGYARKKDGYIGVHLEGHQYLAHRVAWLYVTGSWPEGEIDHIDISRSNNAFENLRMVSRSVNMQNRQKARKNNTTGLLGVSRRSNGFRAVIHTDGKRISLGTYPTPEQAHQVYVEAKRRAHVGCTI